jgi:hypothetical protein
MDSAEKVLNAILEDIEFRKDFLSDRARVISELNVSDAEKEALKSLDVERFVDAAGSVGDHQLATKHI